MTANAYVPAVPEVAEAAFRARRIGLGIMGLGDMMYKLGIRYGSAEGQEFAAQIMEFVRYHAMQQSIELAEIPRRRRCFDLTQPDTHSLLPMPGEHLRPAAAIRDRGCRLAARRRSAPISSTTW